MVGKRRLGERKSMEMIVEEREREIEFSEIYCCAFSEERERNVVWFHVCVCVLCLEKRDSIKIYKE